MKKAKPNRTRINIRVPTELLKWAKAYAKKHNTSLTQTIIDHFTKLKMEAT